MFGKPALNIHDSGKKVPKEVKNSEFLSCRENKDVCYFHKMSIIGINKNNRGIWKYSNVSSAKRHHLNSEDGPVPVFSQSLQLRYEHIKQPDPSQPCMKI